APIFSTSAGSTGGRTSISFRRSSGACGPGGSISTSSSSGGSRRSRSSRLYEGFGLPVLEAMAAGTPVIASNRGALPEVAGDAALLVEPEEGPIVEALGRLAAEEGLREVLLARGEARIALFDWRRAAEMTVRVYEEAAGEPL
ncbi:MAG: glycosyltransferase, partial [Nitrospirae bacterium]|nr:glycosyltransferase [Nitrospirota bacterium]